MEIYGILAESFLFSGIEKDELVRLITAYTPAIKTYKRGELVYSSADPDAKVGFVFSGRCEIRLDRHDGAKALLNSLSVSDSFGVLSVYSEEEFPTKIYAAVNSSVIFFSAEQIKEFVNSNSQISANLVRFLAERISFLNKKIATLSQGRVEDKLAAQLLLEWRKCGSPEFDFNCSKTGERIGAGRASVYRALSSLESDGLIKFDNKKIHILDPQGLERMTK